MFGLIFDFLCFFLTETNLQLGMIPTLRPKFFYPLDLGRPVSNEPPPPPPPLMIANQLKENAIQE